MRDNTLDQIKRADPLVETVLFKISKAIITGRLRPGDKLVETQMGEQLGVSRGPVREAIRRLEQMGIVQKIPYRGAFIANLTDRDIEELHSVRGPLEGLAARLLAERKDPKAEKKLKAILDTMKQAAEDDDHSLIVTLDADFHDTLIELSDHKLLQELWSTIRLRLRSFLLLKPKRLYATLDDAYSLHEPILRAIASGDVEAAEGEIRTHIEAARKQSIAAALTAAEEELEGEELPL